MRRARTCRAFPRRCPACVGGRPEMGCYSGIAAQCDHLPPSRNQGHFIARPPVISTVVASALPRRGPAEPALHSRTRSFSTLLFVDLDVAAGDETSIAVGEIRSGDADEKSVFASAGVGVVAGAHPEAVARLPIDLCFFFE